jgi:Secretion system C-terminal sorting domain/PA domain
MLKYITIIIAITGWIDLKAQTTVSADTIYLATYNTGAQFQLKRAPFGEKKPKLDVVKPMVFAEDSIEVKKNVLAKNAKIPDIADLRIKLTENDKRGATPQPPSQIEIDKAKANKGKRTCEIYTRELDSNMALLDFDKGCDPTYKCFQAQKAGAIGVIVISDNDKKDSVALVKGKYADSLRIPCFSITRSQGESLRNILPSQVALFVPKPNFNSLLASTVLNMEAQAELDKSHITWVNKTSEQNDYFIVEKQNPITGVYETLTTVNTRKGIGLENYTTYDENPMEGDNTYRIKLVLLNGEVQYSEQKVVKFSANSNVKIFPNPTEDVLNLALKGYDTQPLDIAIFDVQGKVIHSQHLDRVSNAALSIPLSDKAVSGQYMLLLKSKGKRDVMRQFTVSR